MKRTQAFKLLLVGPHPPPHGGISVHVARLHGLLERTGVRSKILNTARGATPADGVIPARSALRMAACLLRHAYDGWSLHVHVNGHNMKSWLLALAGGLAGRLAPASLLTVHSGMAPAYLNGRRLWRRTLARLAAACYGRVICVSPAIHEAVAALNIAPARLEILPAFLPAGGPTPAPESIRRWAKGRRPVFATILSFRPEYGFNLLCCAISRLRRRFPHLGCLVVGAGEQRGDAEDLLNTLELRESVVLVGDVPDDVCQALLATADIFVRPTFADGDSLSVREALALGLPVVASDIGLRPPGVLLFPPGELDALVRAMDDAADLPRRVPQNGGENARALLALYGLSREVAECTHSAS